MTNRSVAAILQRTILFVAGTLGLRRELPAEPGSRTLALVQRLVVFLLWMAYALAAAVLVTVVLDSRTAGRVVGVLLVVLVALPRSTMPRPLRLLAIPVWLLAFGLARGHTAMGRERSIPPLAAVNPCASVWHDTLPVAVPPVDSLARALEGSATALEPPQYLTVVHLGLTAYYEAFGRLPDRISAALAHQGLASVPALLRSDFLFRYITRDSAGTSLLDIWYCGSDSRCGTCDDWLARYTDPFGPGSPD